MQKLTKLNFPNTLLHWNKHSNNRLLPWKNEKDAYKIWLSEIILQQTKTEQGLAYYDKFITTYPNISLLSNASKQEVFKLWQGLGYYNRCKNLLATAKHISQNLNNVFPSTYEEILSLKGIGPYTAAAIASFAYGLPHAVVDGNVYRVLARFFGIETSIDSSIGKKEFAILAQNLLDKKNAAAYNQAIMDFGATVCKPKNPICSSCVFAKKCVAYSQNKVQLLPVKSKKIAIKKRFFHYIFFDDGKNIYVQQRIEKDIWQNLFQFYCIESKDEKIPTNNVGLVEAPTVLSQQLTHQKINAYFYFKKINSKNISLTDGLQKVPYGQIKNYAFPKIIVDYCKLIGYL